MSTSNKNHRYSVSIESNADSVALCEFNNLKEAKKWASYYRGGGMNWKGEFSEEVNPSVCIYDKKRENHIYSQPLLRSALRKS